MPLFTQIINMKRKLLPYICFFMILLMVVVGVNISFNNKFPLRYEKEILKYSKEYDLQPEFVASVINTESAFNPDVVSTSGAMGLMQIMPRTAKYISNLMGEKEFKTEMLFNPETNINYGCYYLRYLLSKFETQKVSLSAYNAGEGNVSKWLNDKNYSDDGLNLKTVPYFETLNYVSKIKNSMKYYKKKFEKLKKSNIYK